VTLHAIGPLEGLRVVEFTHFIAGPSAGQRLAELGADVIKVEPPKGDPTRPGPGRESVSHFLAFNRGKRSVVLDLRDPDDERAAQTLAAGADIVLHNVSGESMARHGLDGPSVRAVNPSVIYGSVSGFPSNTARAGQKGFDGIGQAESGMVWVNGTLESGPLKLPYAPVDTATGDALIQGVLAAVIKRLRTGQGSEIEVSLFEGGIHLQQAAWSKFLQTGVNPGRIGNLEADVAPAAEILEVSDGFVIMSAYLPAHFAALCRLLDIEHLLDDPRFTTNDERLANQVELHDLIQAAVDRQGWTVAAAGEAFESIRIAHGVVRSYQDILDGADIHDSGQLARTPRVDGPDYYALNAPYRVAGEQRPQQSPPAPALGEHTAEVLAEIERGEWGETRRSVA
jgi:crotonobetainyl-CoA:carnitine CoA-transferase CaiB-like acyl-CoA transferase